MLKTFFPDLVIWQVCVGLGLFAALYTAAGGLAAVVCTDVLQAVVLLLGTTPMTVLMFAGVGGSWSNVVASVPDVRHPSMVWPIDDAMLPWPGLIVGVTMLRFRCWVTNPHVVQRVQGAKDVGNAPLGALLGGLLEIIPLFTLVRPGAMAITRVPNLPNADMVFPTLVTTVLPVDVTGRVLAGLIAAIVSSVDSTLESGSPLVVHDFVLPRRPGTRPEAIGRLGELTTLVLMALAILWAPQMANFGGLSSHLRQAFSIVVPPMAAIFLVGAVWKRASRDGAFCALLGGHAIGAGPFVLGRLGVWPVHFTIDVGIMTAVSALILGVVSLRGAAPSADVVERTVRRPEMLSEVDEPGFAPSRRGGAGEPGRAGGPGPDGGTVATASIAPCYESPTAPTRVLLAAMAAIVIGFR